MSGSLPISDSDRRDLLSIDGVVSVAVTINESGQEVIAVGVQNEQVAQNAPIPGEVGGFPIVVSVEGQPGFISAQQIPVPENPVATAAGRVNRYRPLQPGVSIGLHTVSAGTSGFLATDGSQVYMVSNNHVLAENDEANIGSAIVQPGPHDGGSPGPDTVGQLEDFVPIGPAGNMVDVAWFRPDVAAADEILDVGTVNTRSIDPQLGDTVVCSGRTSGRFEAVVDQVGATIQVGDVETREFAEIFRISTPFRGGDSGCPVVIETEDGPVPAGIGFAAGASSGYCMYASNVEAATGLSPMTVDGTAGQQAGFGTGAMAVLAIGVGLAALRD